MAWPIFLLSVFLLPFFLPSLCTVSTFFLYTVLFACLIWLASKVKDYFKRERFVIIPLFVFLAVVITTSFFALNPARAFNSAFYTCFGAAVFIFIAGLSFEKKKQIGLVIICASFFISAIALLQRFFYFDKVIPYLVSQKPFLMRNEFFYLLDIIRAKRVISLFPTPNLLAAYLAMVNLLILGYVFSEKQARDVVFFIFLAIVNSYCLWLTMSFAGGASLLMGVTVFLLLFFFRGRDRFKRYAPFFILPVLALSVIVVSIAVERLSTGSFRYSLLFAVDERLNLWKAALSVIAERPFSFAGPANFGNICKDYLAANNAESIMAHNIFLQLWVETGIYGLLAFAWFILSLTRHAVRGIFKPGADFSTAVFRTGALSAVFVFLCSDMAGFSFFVPQTAIIWWILCALLIDSGRDA